MSIGDWEPFWLGPASRRLYAALHSASMASDTGVLLVPPLLHELPRSRRFVAEVANELALLGLPCLRFDFYGTGDSGGSGEELDFGSMCHDLDLAAAALREHADVRRLVVLAWRGSALAVQDWLRQGATADLVVLWEPVADGAAWLRELVASDAAERTQRPPPRRGVPRLTDPADGQLMGFPVSQRLRSDLARACIASGVRDDAPVWLVVRSEAANLPIDIARILHLPANAPVFNGSAAMDATFFLTPPVRDLLIELGQGLRVEVRA